MMRLQLAAWVILATAVAGVGHAQSLQWRDATVEMSDGRTFSSPVSFDRNQILLHNEAQGRKYPIRINELKQLETLIEKEGMEKKWIFKEDGRDEKIYTGDKYPVREFVARMTFGDGRTMEGSIIGGVIQFKDGEKIDRVFLPRKMEGKVGQELKELVYIKKIAFSGETAPAVVGTISGKVTLPQGESLRAVVAIHGQTPLSLAGKVQPDNVFAVTECIHGTYDLAVVSDKAVYFCSNAEVAAKTRWDAAALKEIAEWAKNIREFFNAQDPIYGAGDANRAYVLVRLERYGNTSYEGTELVRRYEVWLMQKPEDEWQIQKRFFISRQLSKVRDVPRERLVIDPQLAGIAVNAERAHVNLKLNLAGQGG